MAKALDIIFLVIGLIAITAGVAMIHVPAAVITGGVTLVTLALFSPIQYRAPDKQGGDNGTS